MNESDRSPEDSTQFFGGAPTSALPVDVCELRSEVQAKYAAVATHPDDDFHFHTGRFVAARCRYDAAVDALPDRAVESFAGVANPFELRDLEPGERVVDLGSGAGMDPGAFRALADAFDARVEGIRRTQDAKARAIEQQTERAQKVFQERASPILIERFSECFLSIAATISRKRIARITIRRPLSRRGMFMPQTTR